MSSNQFNPDVDPVESFIQHFEAAEMKDRLQAISLILADQAIEPDPIPPPLPDGMSQEQYDRFRRAVLEAREWERAYVKGLIRQARKRKP
jgi:hypothetical protein